MANTKASGGSSGVAGDSAMGGAAIATGGRAPDISAGGIGIRTATTASAGATSNTLAASGAGGVPGGGGRAGGGMNALGGSSADAGGAANPRGGSTSANGGSSATGGVTATDGSLRLSWGFAADTEGWSGEFADLPPNSTSDYQLAFAWAALPAEVGPGGGLRITSNNHSDDVFAYVVRQVTGLLPGKTYQLDMTVVIDTNASAECGGIGGAPGASVYFKIGAVSGKPASSVDGQGFLRMNFDKGNQSTDGADMKMVGDISNTLPCNLGSGEPTYQAKTFKLSGFSVKSGADGSLWVVLGTDSGFEGVTTLYYDSISVTLRPSS